ncbi:TPA: hypothetical protein N0F65_003817 [Lagenidium giganteum]|uniref:Reverse transcriptase RNase H-like domain-containing protein n=1 Tax=Lagenidium giganteum TaxID=4803 RepID=A0AAV2YSG6_9STRA|nr:TPA: hypothetical protein N0F65_003817 [Lagenidium giganteum]
MLVHSQKAKPFVIILYVCRWAFGAVIAVIAQERNGAVRPARFVRKVFNGAEVRYTDSEREVLALLKVLDVGFHHLAGSKITVYARYWTLKWLFQSNSMKRVVQWAAMLSPWDLTIVRSDEVPDSLVVLLAASISPRAVFDAILNDVAPLKMTAPDEKICPLPHLTRSDGGFVVTFDEAVKVKEKAGAYGMVQWLLPEWKVLRAAYGYGKDLMVNDSEYQGLIGGLKLAKEHGVKRAMLRPSLSDCRRSNAWSWNQGNDAGIGSIMRPRNSSSNPRFTRW